MRWILSGSFFTSGAVMTALPTSLLMDGWHIAPVAFVGGLIGHMMASLCIAGTGSQDEPIGLVGIATCPDEDALHVPSRQSAESCLDCHGCLS